MNQLLDVFITGEAIAASQRSVEVIRVVITSNLVWFMYERTLKIYFTMLKLLYII